MAFFNFFLLLSVWAMSTLHVPCCSLFIKTWSHYLSLNPASDQSCRNLIHLIKNQPRSPNLVRRLRLMWDSNFMSWYDRWSFFSLPTLRKRQVVLTIWGSVLWTSAVLEQGLDHRQDKVKGPKYHWVIHPGTYSTYIITYVRWTKKRLSLCCRSYRDLGDPTQSPFINFVRTFNRY